MSISPILSHGALNKAFVYGLESENSLRAEANDDDKGWPKTGVSDHGLDENVT
jgi:hypothetical protein